MIKLSHIVTASPEQMVFVIEGMRNPMNSWEKSDSDLKIHMPDQWANNNIVFDPYEFVIGSNDQDLMGRLAAAGTDHRKFMRMMPIYMRVEAPLYWWKEFDTYKVATVRNSCSTMHKITEKQFTMDDFSTEHLSDLNKRMLNNIIESLNYERSKYLENKDKTHWWQIIQMLPSSYNQTANILINYETARNIYNSRKNHKLDEWHKFCDALEQLPYWQLITE